MCVSQGSRQNSSMSSLGVKLYLSLSSTHLVTMSCHLYLLNVSYIQSQVIVKKTFVGSTDSYMPYLSSSSNSSPISDPNINRRAAKETKLPHTFFVPLLGLSV